MTTILEGMRQRQKTAGDRFNNAFRNMSPFSKCKSKGNRDFSLDTLKRAVSGDQSISPKQQETVLQMLRDPDFVSELKSGAIGAALSYLLSRYLDLKPETKILVSIAGFGVGKLIYDFGKDNKRFSTYNPETRMEEIN